MESKHPSGGWRIVVSAAFTASLLISPALAAAPGPVACAGARPPVTPLGANHLAATALLDRIAPPAAGVRAVKSGAWSDPATWGGKTPSGRVVIPSGIGVVFDLPNSPTLQSVRVEGCLELSDRISTRLNTEFIYVAPKGEFLAGAPNAPLPANVTAEIIFADLGPIDVATDTDLMGKGLVAASRVRLYGATKTPRVKVAAAPKRGQTSIALASAPTGWRVGDRVILTGTVFIPQKTKSTVVLASPTQDEIGFIKAINGTSVTLAAPLAFDHLSPDPAVGAYLVNYSRNIRLATAGSAQATVSRRAHSMYMSTETTIQGVEFFEMGRTDKSVRAFNKADVAKITSTSNLKGRYPLHLHQGGFVADNVAPMIRDVAVWGSPGWGIAQHNGNAFLFRNNTWNIFGAAFVSESGNETGAWVENTAIKGIGVDHLVKDASDVRAYDLGRTGDGFWLQSRQVRVHNNLAVGMTGGMGFVFFHRGNDLGSRFPLTPAFVANNFCMSGAMRFRNQSIDKPGILQFTDNEVIASETGFHVTKPSPQEPHDIRSVLDNFTAWEVKTGVSLGYTSRYTVKNGLIIGSNAAGSSLGVDFGKNTYDLVVAGTTIKNVTWGVDLSKLTTRVFGPSSAYVVAGAKFSGVASTPYRNQDTTDIVMASLPAVKTPQIAYKWGNGPVTPTMNALYLYISGQKTDSLGAVPYPVANNEFMVNWTNFKNMTAERGWYFTQSGARAMVMPDFYSDRMTGEIFQNSIIVVPNTYFIWPNRLASGAAANQGTINPNAAPPLASNDSARLSANMSATIAAFANDSSADGALKPAGFTPARNGNVEQLPNGSFVYTPYPDFRGADQFNYWVSNRQGLVTRATVNVTVN